MLKIGLTGNIATGKTTVSAILAEQGALVVDSDQLTRELMRPGTAVYERIVETFGQSVLRPEGCLDRAALGAVVFGDPARLRELEEIVHPAVAELRERKIRQSCAAVAVLEAVKLVESGQYRQCDELWVVTSTRNAQLSRLMTLRGMSQEDAEARLRAQPAQEEKRHLADVVIENNGTLEELRDRVKREWRRFVG